MSAAEVVLRRCAGWHAQPLPMSDVIFVMLKFRPSTGIFWKLRTVASFAHVIPVPCDLKMSSAADLD